MGDTDKVKEVEGILRGALLTGGLITTGASIGLVVVKLWKAYQEDKELTGKEIVSAALGAI